MESSAWAVLRRAAESPKPERDLVAALEQLLPGEVAVLAPWGEVLAGRAVGSVRREVRDEGRLLGTLVSATESELLDLAASVYALAVLRREARVAKLSAASEALLAELVSGSRAPDLPERLEASGLAGERFAVAALEFPRRRPRSRLARSELHADLERLRAAGDALFASLGYPFLSGVRGHRAVWWWGTADPDAQLPRLRAAVLAATPGEGEDVRLGVSEAHDDPARGGDAFTQALLALSSTNGPRSAQVFGRLDPLHWVLASQPPGHLALWRDSLLRPLEAHDEDGRLLETLKAYLHDPSHMGALAERLHVHPNTLRARLGRIEELLGQPLSHPATLARLYLALGTEF